MTRIRIASLATIVALAGLTASVQGAEARHRVRYTAARYVGASQHATVMNNIYQAQQQNNAVINQVQNNIRANQQRPY